MGIVPWLPFWETKRGIAMNTLEILTLLLVVFAALTYIDNHNSRKYTENELSSTTNRG